MTTSSSNRMPDAGLLLLRLAVGLGIAAHGAQKLFGFFDGPGLAGAAKGFESMGFAPGMLFASMAGSAELIGGLLIAVGLLGVIGPALVTGVMLVAVVTVHLTSGFFASGNGYELPLMYTVMALGLAFIGFGRYALDTKLRLRAFEKPAVVAGALSASIVGALAMTFIR